MRITSTNINGLSNILEYLQYIIENTQFESDVHCYQEINLDRLQPEVVREIQKVTSHLECSRGDGIITSSSPSVPRQGIKNKGQSFI